jgi:hypothetical protein
MVKTSIALALFMVLLCAASVQATYTEFKNIRCLALTNNGPVTIPNQTTVTYLMDTQSLIANHTLRSDCADVRVIYNDSRINWTYGDSLDFAQVTCNQANTTIRFQVQQDIEPNATDTSYCIYFNNNESDPLQFSNIDLYLFYDNFNRANTDTVGRALKGGDWTEWEDNATNWVIQSNRVKLLANNDQINYELHGGNFSLLSSPLMHAGAKVGSQKGSHQGNNEAMLAELYPRINDLIFEVSAIAMNVSSLSWETEPTVIPFGNYTTSTMVDVVMSNLSGTTRFKANGVMSPFTFQDVPQETLTYFRFEFALDDLVSETYYIDDVRLWAEPIEGTLQISET